MSLFPCYTSTVTVKKVRNTEKGSGMAKFPSEVTAEEIEQASQAIAESLVKMEGYGIRKGNVTFDLLFEMRGKLDELTEKVQQETIKREELEKTLRGTLEFAREAREATERGESPVKIFFRIGQRLNAFFSDAFSTRSAADGGNGAGDGEADTGEK